MREHYTYQSTALLERPERPPLSGQLNSWIRNEAQRKALIVVEGPPIYLWPDQRYASQQWEHPAFVKGWHLARQISQILPEGKVQQAVLVDEYNNVPEHTSLAAKQDKLDDLLHHSLPLQATLFSRESSAFPVLARKESAYVSENGMNQCSHLDSGFQLEKLTTLVREGHLSPRELSSVMLLVIHPTAFQEQQLHMLQAFLGRMKDSLSEVGRKYRPRLLEEVYRHIWLDEAGEIKQVTQPEWKGGAFVHKQLV